MTRMIEDWIDSLPDVKNVHSSSLREASLRDPPRTLNAQRVADKQSQSLVFS
jgi:hypothetical protein